MKCKSFDSKCHKNVFLREWVPYMEGSILFFAANSSSHPHPPMYGSL